MWKISKDFFCDYGHRVWSQELKEEYCAIGDTQCACRHLHGHTGKITIALQGDTLTRGMVTDFKHLGVIGDFIDLYFDHKMILDRNDPSFYDIIGMDEDEFLERNLPVYIDGSMIAGHTITPDPSWPQHRREIVEGFFVVDFVPTSEHLAEHVYNLTEHKLRDLAIVNSVSWQETPKSCAVFTRNSSKILNNRV